MEKVVKQCLGTGKESTVLHEAIVNGFTTGVEILLNHNPALAKGDKPERALITAAKHGAPARIIELLVENGSDINVRDAKNQNKTPLILAACGANSETVEALLKYPDCDRNAKGDPPKKVDRIDEFHTGLTSLLEAIKLLKRGAPVVEALVRNGADVNITGETELDGHITPLMLASMYGLTNVVDMLLKAGAPVDVKDDSSQTALHWAVKGAQLDKHSESDVVQPLIKAGADLNAVSNCGGDNITPVQRAADIGSYLAPMGHDLTKILIEAGSEINRQDMYGKTLLHRALGCGWNDIIDLLFERHCDVTICDYSGHSVMYDIATAFDSSVETMLRLLDHNCDVKSRYTLTEQCNIRIPNMTLLEVALHNGNLRIVPLLLEAGCPYHSVNVEEYEFRVVMEENVYRWLQEIKLKPRSLKGAARMTIRDSLPVGCRVESALTKVALPKDLQDYVLLRSGVESF